MSVQLIVYPQTYNGYYNSTSYPVTNPLITGGNGSFPNLNNTSAYGYNGGLSFSLQQISIAAQPPVIQNQWYRYHTTGGSYYANIAAPQNVAGSKCNFSGAFVTTPNASGVYIRIAGLTAGTQYTVGLEIDTSDDGQLYLNILDPNTYSIQAGTNPNPASSSSASTTFVWNDTELVIAIEWEGFYDGIGQSCTINNVKMFETQNPSSMVFTDLSDGQVICDLYEDENIPLTLSVDDFKNVAEKVQSYSKAFDLPATKRNNQIFNDMFEITRTADGTLAFNPYIKTKCILKQDGFTLFDGYLRMIDINDKEGEISYNVNMYSEAIALADVLKDKKFVDLDFVELAHDYQKQNIKRSWNDSPDPSITYLNPSTSGFRDDYTTLRYPFIDWSHQIAVGGTNANAATAGNPELLKLEDAFRPCINIKYLIDRIFNQTINGGNFPFTYTSTFFNTADFKKLYMDFNWGEGLFGQTSDGEEHFLGYEANVFTPTAGPNYATASYDVMELSELMVIGGQQVWTGGYPPNYNGTTSVITSTQANEQWTITYTYIVENTDTVARDIECRWLETNNTLNTTTVHNYTSVQSIAAGGTFTYSGTVEVLLQNIGDTLQAQFKTNAGTASKVRQGTAIYVNSSFGAVFFQKNVLQVTVATLLQTSRGDLGQWEFLKGLMTMFNLVTIPDKDNPNNLLIEPYADVFINETASGTVSDLSLKSRGINHDWTEKIDISDIKLTPLTDLNKKTIFKFVEDDDDYAFNNYKLMVQGHLYGSKIYDASAFTVLDGEKEIIAEPFAATVPKAVMEQFPDFIVPAIYSYNPEDDTSEAFDNSPRIFYNNGIKPTGVTYFIPAQNGFSNENQPDFLQFTHLTQAPITSNAAIDFHFGECQTMGLGSTPNNLFNMYWQPYYDELYNPDTRTMTLKVNLSAADINMFNFYDTVMIKNRQFRVNRIDYKPHDLSTVEFILIP